jgi:hypothetical protein
MLWPSAVLIVLLLASIAVDFSVVLMGRRELLWAADAAANDAATYGIDQDVYRRTNAIELDVARVDRAVTNSLRSRGLDFELVGPPDVRIEGGSVVVTVTARVDYLFADGFPLLPDGETVRVTARSTPRNTSS